MADTRKTSPARIGRIAHAQEVVYRVFKWCIIGALLMIVLGGLVEYLIRGGGERMPVSMCLGALIASASGFALSASHVLECLELRELIRTEELSRRVGISALLFSAVFAAFGFSLGATWLWVAFVQF
jgi:hypothetical protein